MVYDFEVSGVVGASAEDVYEAWLSSERHSAMTGGAAQIDPVVGGRFTAWDGYITGETVVLEPFHRIVQSWRTSQFTDEHADSQIDVTFDARDDGTLVTVRHSNVPADQLGYENGGWQKSYFDPMSSYFASR